MVWQENCRVIVMTTKETERGKNKCARYWPEQGSEKEFGKCKVKNLIESSTPHYTLREFLVAMEGAVGERRVYHYHFTVKQYFLAIYLQIIRFDYFFRHGQIMVCLRIRVAY